MEKKSAEMSKFLKDVVASQERTLPELGQENRAPGGAKADIKPFGL